MFSTRSQLGMFPLILLVLFIGLQQEANAFHHNFMGRYYKGQLYKDYIFDRMHGLEFIRPTNNDTVCVNDNKKTIVVDFFDQPLDHFATDPDKSGKWGQHYQVNDQFFDKDAKNPVVFLMIGGEGPMSNKWVCYEQYVYMQAAKQYKAKVIQLEHRFFGNNKGLKDLSVNSLQYLTTEQALADINSFILGYNKMQKWDAPKWVAFGGSYPGTIAGLLRLKYPGITQGNVASSAPLRPVVDFWEYALVMENAIRDTSMECYNATQLAFKTLVDYTLNPDQRINELNKKLHLDPPLDNRNVKKEDLDTITSTIFSSFQDIIQYTYVGAADRFENGTGERRNLGYTCQIMTNTSISDPIDRLYNVYKLTVPKDVTTLVSSYEKSIEDFKNETLAPTEGASMRGWMWLSCNEFGWLQSTSNNGLFGDVVPISLYIKQCKDLFSNTLNRTIIDQRIRDTENRYGSTYNYNATNVFLPNGLYDPWSSLGVQDNQTLKATRETNHLITHFTPQAAHCADMYGYYVNEPSGLNETRQIFAREVDFYLKQDSTFGKGKSNGASGAFMTVFMFPVVLAYFLLFN